MKRAFDVVGVVAVVGLLLDVVVDEELLVDVVEGFNGVVVLVDEVVVNVVVVVVS